MLPDALIFNKEQARKRTVEGSGFRLRLSQQQVTPDSEQNPSSPRISKGNKKGTAPGWFVSSEQNRSDSTAPLQSRMDWQAAQDFILPLKHCFPDFYFFY